MQIKKLFEIIQVRKLRNGTEHWQSRKKWGGRAVMRHQQNKQKFKTSYWTWMSESRIILMILDLTVTGN